MTKTTLEIMNKLGDIYKTHEFQTFLQHKCLQNLSYVSNKRKVINGTLLKIYKILSKYQDTGNYHYIGFYHNNPSDLSVLDIYKLGANPNLSFEENEQMVLGAGVSSS